MATAANTLSAFIACCLAACATTAPPPHAPCATVAACERDRDAAKRAMAACVQTDNECVAQLDSLVAANARHARFVEQEDARQLRAAFTKTRAIFNATAARFDRCAAGSDFFACMRATPLQGEPATCSRFSSPLETVPSEIEERPDTWAWRPAEVTARAPGDPELLGESAADLEAYDAVLALEESRARLPVVAEQRGYRLMSRSCFAALEASGAAAAEQIRQRRVQVRELARRQRALE